MDGKENETITQISVLPPIKFIKEISIRNPPKRSNELIKMLNDNLSDSLTSFSLLSASEGSPIDTYFESILVGCSKANKMVNLQKFKMNYTQLSKIIKSSSQCEEICLGYCQITTEGVLNFKIDDDYKLKVINFHHSGDSGTTRSNWNKDQSEIAKIIEAMSDSGIKQSLQVLMPVSSTKITDKIQHILNFNGMRHVKAT